jgi:hypothetical protein
MRSSRAHTCYALAKLIVFWLLDLVVISSGNAELALLLMRTMSAHGISFNRTRGMPLP